MAFFTSFFLHLEQYCSITKFIIVLSYMEENYSECQLYCVSDRFNVSLCYEDKMYYNNCWHGFRRVNLERRRGDYDKCVQLYESYIASAKNKVQFTYVLDDSS